MLDEFIAMTREAIAESGLDQYLPTLLLLDRQQVLVLEAEFADVSQEGEAYDWIAGHVQGFENYLVAFRADAEHFKVFGRVAGKDVERVCRAIVD
jgi:hypothetical protein